MQRIQDDVLGFTLDCKVSIKLSEQGEIALKIKYEHIVMICKSSALVQGKPLWPYKLKIE